MQKIPNLSVTTPLTATILTLLVGSYGCIKKAPEEVKLEIQSIQPAGSQGVYTVVGTTDLPEYSRISVMAVRYLRPIVQEERVSLRSQVIPNRSILARENVEVKKDGQWEATLRLWKVAPNGSFQEVWQADQGQMKVSPESRVNFIAVFNPGSQQQKSERLTSATNTLENQNLEGKLVRFTNEGEKFVQATQAEFIPLPEGKTVPPRPQPEDINGGWGNRYQIRPQPVASRTITLPATKSQKTNAPLSPSEFLR
ncbi:MAG: hypothetical protein QNJ47_01820 [Nostocaceae cyanobacterium]|nr:hypothetical protein [Nostocaceae cyanobacterium]